MMKTSTTKIRKSIDRFLWNVVPNPLFFTAIFICSLGALLYFGVVVQIRDSTKHHREYFYSCMELYLHNEPLCRMKVQEIIASENHYEAIPLPSMR